MCCDTTPTPPSSALTDFSTAPPLLSSHGTVGRTQRLLRSAVPGHRVGEACTLAIGELQPHGAEVLELSYSVPVAAWWCMHRACVAQSLGAGLSVRTMQVVHGLDCSTWYGSIHRGTLVKGKTELYVHIESKLRLIPGWVNDDSSHLAWNFLWQRMAALGSERWFMQSVIGIMYQSEDAYQEPHATLHKCGMEGCSSQCVGSRCTSTQIDAVNTGICQRIIQHAFRESRNPKG